MWQKVSTLGLPETDRFDWFTDLISTALMPSDFSARDRVGFRAEGAVLDLGGPLVSRFAYSPLHSRRTPALIRRGDPEQYQLGLVSRGTAWFAQNGRECEVRAGEMVLWDTSMPYHSGSGTDGGAVEILVLQIPKPLLPLPSQRVAPLLAQRIPAGSGLGAILAGYLSSLMDHAPDGDPVATGTLGTAAVDMAAACLVQQLGGVATPAAETRAPMMRRRIDRYIEHHLPDPGLTPRRIAAHHHISLRTLYTLFDEDAYGVAADIRRRRLDRACADLARPGHLAEPVQTIAARWGFANAGSFTRTFREVFGMTPTEYRRTAIQASADGTSAGSSTRGAGSTSSAAAGSPAARGDE